MPESPSAHDTDKMLLIRLGVSLALIVASLLTDSFLSVIFAVAAAVISGYDIVLDAVECASRLDFFNKEFLSSLAVLALFIIGCRTEAAAVFPAYQLGMLFFKYGSEKTEESGAALLNYCGERDKNYLLDYMNKSTFEMTSHASEISSAAKFVLIIAAGFSVLFAVLSPLIFKFSYAEAVRRAAAIFIVCSSFSVCASSGTLSKLGLCRSASMGITFFSSQGFSNVTDCDCVAIEKEGVITKSLESGALFSSDVMPTERMIMICAHAVADSQQPFAKPILNVYNGELNHSIISDFKEINGVGVGVNISGMHAVLANKEYYKKRGVELPAGSAGSGQVYFLTINGKYAGSVSINEGLDDKYISFTDKLRAADIEKCALITLEPKDTAEQTAYNFAFDFFYPDCYKDSFDSVLSDFSAKSGNVLLIHSELDRFKKAYCDISVNQNSTTNHVHKDSVENIPEVISLSNRVRLIEEENAIIVFIIKALLIALAITGIGKAWFSVFIDLAAASATFLNSLRITGQQDNSVNI